MLGKKFPTVLILGFVVMSVVAPLVVSAADLVPCGKEDGTVMVNGVAVTKAAGDQCDFRMFVELVERVINYIMIISIPVTAIAFAWIGIILMTAQGNVTKIREAKEVAWKVLVGFIIILVAWVLVYTIANTLLEDGYNFFLKE